MKYFYNAAKGNLKSQEKADVSIGGSFTDLYKKAVGILKGKLQEEKELLRYLQDEE